MLLKWQNNFLLKGGMKGLQNMLSQMGPGGMPKIPR